MFETADTDRPQTQEVDLSVTEQPVDLAVQRGERPHRRLQRQLDQAIGTPYPDLTAGFTALISEGDLKAHNARRATRWWSRTYYALGLPAAILAVLSAATGLASETLRYVAGGLALLSAGFSAAVAFLESDLKRQHSDALAAQWQALADEARIALLAGWPDQATGIVTLKKLTTIKSRLQRGVLVSDEPDTDRTS